MELFGGRCSPAVAGGTEHHRPASLGTRGRQGVRLGRLLRFPALLFGQCGGRVTLRAVPLGAEASRGAPAACSAHCLRSHPAGETPAGLFLSPRGRLCRLEQVPSD